MERLLCICGKVPFMTYLASSTADEGCYYEPNPRLILSTSVLRAKLRLHRESEGSAKTPLDMNTLDMNTSMERYLRSIISEFYILKVHASELTL